ncbi:hypothetical protein FPQ18DRAFT_304789 [Pyronema domesticum]|nr:hypothetical protein FPQ18DRAFT_304789 [Pyronema domesticum]
MGALLSSEASDAAAPGKPSYHTFRIREIPSSVTEEQLRVWLSSLSASTPVTQSNIRAKSLVPYNNGQTATVTFCCVPKVFQGQPEVMATFGDVQKEVSIDSDFYGITPLYSSAEPSPDIIAVPGLEAHAFGTWKSRNGYKMWLRDFLPTAFPNARILLYGYRSDLRGNTSTDSIQDHAGQLLIQLQHIRSDEKVILQIKAGIPNRGLGNNNLLSLVRDQKNARLVQDLGHSSALSRVIHQNFAQVLKAAIPNCRVMSFYEVCDSNSIEETPDGSWKQTGARLRLVTIESATHAIPTEAFHDQISLDTDHSGLVKFE